MSKTIEKRAFQTTEIEVREDGEKRTIAGYAAKFNLLSEDLGFFREKIKPGAFASSISGDIRALWSHNTDLVLGRTRNNTLRLQEDSEGLFFELDLPDTQLGRDTFTTIKRGDVSGMSFGFMVRKDSWERGTNGAPDIRTLEDVELFEVSPTAFPAYPQTDVSARSLEEVRAEGLRKLSESEKVLSLDHYKRKLRTRA